MVVVAGQLTGALISDMQRFLFIGKAGPPCRHPLAHHRTRYEVRYPRLRAEPLAPLRRQRLEEPMDRSWIYNELRACGGAEPGREGEVRQSGLAAGNGRKLGGIPQPEGSGDTSGSTVARPGRSGRGRASRSTDSGNSPPLKRPCESRPASTGHRAIDEGERTRVRRSARSAKATARRDRRGHPPGRRAGSEAKVVGRRATKCAKRVNASSAAETAPRASG